MFRELQKVLPPGEAVFDLHPVQITAYLDVIWEARRLRAPSATGPRPVVPGVGDISSNFGTSGLAATLFGANTSIPSNLVTATAAVLNGAYTKPFGWFWQHIIYAYLLENTRMVQIFRRVVEEASQGERFGALSPASHNWLRNTEEVFYRGGDNFSILNLTSSIRPVSEETRRNAYYRFLGMDLNHGTVDNRPVSFVKPQAANTSFVMVFQELLREVWRGYTNVKNLSGPNTTDSDRIGELANQLQIMLLDRRQVAGTSVPGALSREEYVAVTTLDWFHLTLLSDSPIVTDLKASATRPEDRLRKLGEAVGLPAHQRSRSFFLMADPASTVLRSIEDAGGSSPTDFYDYTNTLNTLPTAMLTLINQWSNATGVDLKSVPTSVGR